MPSVKVRKVTGTFSHYLINLIACMAFGMQGGMPRLSRLDAPGILHHVIIRGIERKNIFRDTTDKQNNMDGLGAVSLMQRLLTGYAVSFNPAFSGTIAAMVSCFKTGTNPSGLAMGRRPELVGGGLIRSLGGWSEVKKMRLKGMDRIKGDERILGDSDFVLSVLSQANERFERRYELKRRGYDMTRVAERVAQKNARMREVYFARWCASEVGLPQTELARELEMTVSGIGYAVRRGRNLRRTRRLHVD
ncbi:MAG: hypothetical protein U5R30_04775 [Deltaproteobacteria bacterium]|nr:hypothetical protein [Deltaproteobacteria bacterium]